MAQSTAHNLLADASLEWHLQHDADGRTRLRHNKLTVESLRRGGIPQTGIDARPSMAWARVALPFLNTGKDFTLTAELECYGIEFSKYIGVAVNVKDETSFVLFNFTEEKANSFTVADSHLQSGEYCSINVFTTKKRISIPVELRYRSGIMQFWVNGACVQTRYLGQLTSRTIAFVALGRQKFKVKSCSFSSTE